MIHVTIERNRQTIRTESFPARSGQLDFALDRVINEVKLDLRDNVSDDARMVEYILRILPDLK